MTVPLTRWPSATGPSFIRENGFHCQEPKVSVPCDAGPDPPVGSAGPSHWPEPSPHDAGQDRISNGASGPRRVGPDGNTVLYARLGSAGDDLMLIENFH